MGRGNKFEHDRFFKEIFSQKEWAIKLCRLQFSSSLIRELDLENIQIHMEKSYPIINKITGLKGERRTDILYVIPFKYANAKLYVLLEHKSNPEPDFMRQLNEKIESIRINEGDFIILRPVLFYQNKNPWPYEWDLTQRWNLSEKLSATLKGNAMEYQIELFDLGRKDPRELDTCLTMQAFLYTMKYIRSEDIGTKVSEIYELLSKAQTPDKWILKISSYIFEYWDAQPEIVEQFANLIENPKLRRESMALADRIYDKGVNEGKKVGKKAGIKEGKREGIKEGEKTGRIKVAGRLLKNGMGIEEVLDTADITLKDLEDAAIIPRNP